MKEINTVKKKQENLYLLRIMQYISAITQWVSNLLKVSNDETRTTFKDVVQIWTDIPKNGKWKNVFSSVKFFT